ncbi:hypothetical protein LINPERHAP2_LOCUS40696 [Linum perenne]
MAMEFESAMVATITDHYNHHYDADAADGDGEFTFFFDQEEEEKLLLQAMDAELAQELQFQEALRASLILSSESEDDPHTAAADPPVEVKWEAGEPSLRFCEICKERKEDHLVVRNVYDNDRCVCFSCINSSAASGNKVKKDKTTKQKQQQYYKKKSAQDGRSSRCSPEKADGRRHQRIPKDSSNRRRASSGDVKGTVYEEESWEVTKEKLKKANQEIRVLMDRIQLQHRENVEAMDFQEQFFRDQIRSILERNAAASAPDAAAAADDDDADADDDDVGDGKEELEEKI